MTWTLTPFDDKHRLDGRSYQNRIGRPFYGHALKRVIGSGLQESSLVCRVTDYYFSHRWPAMALLAFGIIVASVTLAAWICL